MMHHHDHKSVRVCGGEGVLKKDGRGRPVENNELMQKKYNYIYKGRMMIFFLKKKLPASSAFLCASSRSLMISSAYTALLLLLQIKPFNPLEFLLGE